MLKDVRTWATIVPLTNFKVDICWGLPSKMHSANPLSRSGAGICPCTRVFYRMSSLGNETFPSNDGS